jgi:rhomboid domain-containing protein 1
MLSNIPLSTSFFGAVCIFTYTLQVLLNPNIFHYTYNTQRILFYHEYYRIFTSPFFHESLLHIAMNMFSYMALGKSLETRFGTLYMFSTVLGSIIGTCLMQILLSFLASTILARDDDKNHNLLNRHSIGFSAVLFHLLVLDSKCHPSASFYSIANVVHVPAKYYPWVLLCLMQVLMPNISFLGHLSGILCGILQSNGFLQCCSPSIEFLRFCDDSQHLRFITSQQSYVQTPVGNDVFALFSNNRGTRVIAVDCFTRVCKVMRDVYSTARNVITITIATTTTTTTMNRDHVMRSEDDDQTVGFFPKTPTPQGTIQIESEMV